MGKEEDEDEEHHWEELPKEVMALVFQTPECILHVFKELGIVCFDLGFPFFYWVLKFKEIKAKQLLQRELFWKLIVLQKLPERNPLWISHPQTRYKHNSLEMCSWVGIKKVRY